MIHEKSFHLKVRKAKVRWGCACCQPVQRNLTHKAGRRIVQRLVKAKKLSERDLLEMIESE